MGLQPTNTNAGRRGLSRRTPNTLPLAPATDSPPISHHPSEHARRAGRCHDRSRSHRREPATSRDEPARPEHPGSEQPPDAESGPMTARVSEPTNGPDQRGPPQRATGIGSAAVTPPAVIYGTAAALVFDELFFPDAEPAVGTLIAFATFGVAFLFDLSVVSSSASWATASAAAPLRALAGRGCSHRAPRDGG